MTANARSSTETPCIWLIGSKGMLGTELSLLLENSGAAFTGTGREVDITDPAAFRDFVARQGVMRPFTWIINCAAYTAVDKAEEDIEACRRLNTDGPGNIAAFAQSIGARLIHFSTDYVFDGKGIISHAGALRPYQEDDPTGPVNIYGSAKLEGELRALENNKASYVIRTAWLYGRHGGNFVHTMIRLMNERDAVSVVNDQRGSPTWTRDLATVVFTLIQAVDSGKPVPYGIYHYTNEGNITWFDFAKEIYRLGRELGLVTRDCAINPCTSAEYSSKAKRPAYSVLDKSKIKAALEIEIPGWDMSLKAYLDKPERGYAQ